MSTEIVQKSVFDPLAEKYNMASAAQVLQILKQTVLKGSTRYTPSDADAAAFAIVCNAYDLNPFKREIHGFCDSDKGVVPIVGIDGWSTIVNRRQDYDGCSFDEVTASDDWGITCTIFVKGRSQPTKVTEWFKECVRDTAPWKMKRRMLRHKAFIQCARLAFGLGGIFDEDEARDIISRDGIPVIEAGTPVAQPTRTEQARKAFAPEKAEGGVNPEIKETVETSVGELPAKKGAGSPKKAPKPVDAPKATEKPQDELGDFADNLPEDETAASPTVNPAGETAAEASGDVNKETGEAPGVVDAKELALSRGGELVGIVRGMFKGMDLPNGKHYVMSLLKAAQWQVKQLADDRVFDDAKDTLTRWCELHKLAAGDHTLTPSDGFNRVAAVISECSMAPTDIMDDSQLGFAKKAIREAAKDWAAILKKHKK